MTRPSPYQPHPLSQRQRTANHKLLVVILVVIVVLCGVLPGGLFVFAMLAQGTGPEVGECLGSAEKSAFGRPDYVDCDSAEAKYVVITRMESRTYSCPERDGIVKMASAPPSNRSSRKSDGFGYDGWTVCLEPK